MSSSRQIMSRVSVVLTESERAMYEIPGAVDVLVHRFSPSPAMLGKKRTAVTVGVISQSSDGLASMNETNSTGPGNRVPQITTPAGDSQ